MASPGSYAEAGVDRNKEEKAVTSILKMIKKTYVNAEIPEGHFAGSIPFGDHLLSLANDGVGTKLILAQELDKLDTIGIDAVAMCVNDLVTIGSIPAAFVDYIAIMEPEEQIIEEIVKGLVEGCVQAEVPLVGGETATVPDILKPIANSNGFDVAGTALGIHLKSDSVTGVEMKPGDVIIAVESNGIHSNGLTLARKLVKTIDEKRELLKPTRIYVKMVKQLLQTLRPHGMAHITCGGVTNLSRLGEYHFHLDRLDQLPKQNIFSKLMEYGSISLKEMYRTFNMGFGFVVIVDPSEEESALKILNSHFPSYTVGSVKEGTGITIELDGKKITYP